MREQADFTTAPLEAARSTFAHEVADPLALIHLNVALLERALVGDGALPEQERATLARIASRTLEAVRKVSDASTLLRALDG